jgi:lipoprotein-releasing system ATP-binding protein
MSEALVIDASEIVKTYFDGKLEVEVLKGLDFKLKPGEQVSIMGPSGCGKSTLLHLLGGLDKVTSGSLSLMGKNVNKLSEKKRCQLRNKHLGFVYQFHHLLPEFTALENVCMPLLLGNHSVSDAKEQASAMLDKVQLSHRVSHKPSKLSGGERQRVAIARALVTKPKCLLADEPTGNLDQKTAHAVFELMMELNQESQTALVIVTHDTQLAEKMQRMLQLNNGRLEP